MFTTGVIQWLLCKPTAVNLFHKSDERKTGACILRTATCGYLVCMWRLIISARNIPSDKPCDPAARNTSLEPEAAGILYFVVLRSASTSPYEIIQLRYHTRLICSEMDFNSWISVPVDYLESLKWRFQVGTAAFMTI